MGLLEGQGETPVGDLELDIPKDVVDRLGLGSEAGRELRTELALSLMARGALSLADACRLARREPGEIRRRLDEWHAAVRDADLASGPLSARDEAAVEDRLRALGYID